MSFTRLTRILRLYIRSFFFFFPRQCVAPIALMDEPPLPLTLYEAICMNVLIHVDILYTSFQLYNTLPHMKDPYTKSEQNRHNFENILLKSPTQSKAISADI